MTYAQLREFLDAYACHPAPRIQERDRLRCTSPQGRGRGPVGGTALLVYTQPHRSVKINV